MGGRQKEENRGNGRGRLEKAFAHSPMKRVVTGLFKKRMQPVELGARRNVQMGIK